MTMGRKGGTRHDKCFHPDTADGLETLMSRGPGKIERAIEALFTDCPSNAYTVEDLIDRVYRGVNQVEKKHRVSVIRAAKKVCERLPGWTWKRSETGGGTLVFSNHYDVLSYAIGRKKADFVNRYRSNDPRLTAYPWLIETDDSIRASFDPGGENHEWVAEGGAWWRHVQLNIANRDNDTSERIQKLRAEQDKANALAAAIMRRPL